MIRIRTNLIGGTLAVIFGTAILLLLPSQIEVEKQIGVSRIGADLLPRIVTILMIVLGALLIAQSLVLKQEKIVEYPVEAARSVAAVFAILAACLLVFHIAGYIACGLALSCLFLWYLRSRDWKEYAVCAALTLAIYFSFRFLLHVPIS